MIGTLNARYLALASACLALRALVSLGAAARPHQRLLPSFGRPKLGFLAPQPSRTSDRRPSGYGAIAAPTAQVSLGLCSRRPWARPSQRIFRLSRLVRLNQNRWANMRLSASNQLRAASLGRTRLPDGSETSEVSVAVRSSGPTPPRRCSSCHSMLLPTTMPSL